jgi:hypothetical protein
VPCLVHRNCITKSCKIYCQALKKCLNTLKNYKYSKGLSRLIRLQLILCKVAGPYHSSKSTLPFGGLQHMQQCQFQVPSFDPNEWCLKNGLHSGGLIPGPLSHESSALNTRPRLLALMNFVSFVHFRCAKLLHHILLGGGTHALQGSASPPPPSPISQPAFKFKKFGVQFH